MSMRIALKIPINASTGYGRDGIGLTRALSRMGCDVTLEPTNVTAPIPWDVAELLTHEPNEPVDLRIHHVPPNQLGLTQYDLDTTYKAFAWTMWEFFEFKPEDKEEMKARTTGYHGLFVYDETSKAAYDDLGEDGLPPISILQGGYDPDDWIVQEDDPIRDWDADTFRFVIAGDLQSRKNPFAAMRVIRRLKDEGYDVELMVKTRHEKSFPFDVEKIFPGVRVFTGIWSQKQMRQYYEQAHCYIAPSLGEGKNLPAIEAGTTGCAIIASDVGGHRQWAHPAFATLVPGDTEGQYDGLPHVKVDEELLYQECKNLVENRSKARAMGIQAAKTLPAMLSWDRVARTITQQAYTGRS